MKKPFFALCTIILTLLFSSCQKMSEFTVNGSWDVENITIRNYEGNALIDEESRSPKSGDIFQVHFYVNSDCTFVIKGEDGANPERKSYTWAMARKRLVLIDENDPALSAIVYQVDQSYLESITLTATIIDANRRQVTILKLRKQE